MRKPYPNSLLRRLAKPLSFARVVGVAQKTKQEDWKRFSSRHEDWGRDLASCLARELCGLTLHQLGQWAGKVDSRTVSTAIRRFWTPLEKDHPLARLFAQAANELSVVAA